MLFGKEDFRKINNGKYLIGYELSSHHVQISFLKIGDTRPYTFSLVAGMEEYDIPLCLCFNQEENLWFMGKEAMEKKKEAGIRFIGNLLELAYGGEPVWVGEVTCDPKALLALYIKKSLSLLSLETTPENIAGIMFVLDYLDAKRVEAMREMVDFLQLPHIEMQFMGKEESFFWYNLYSEQSLWKNQVMLYELKNDHLQGYRLYLNQNTSPVVTIVEREEYPEFAESSPAARGEVFLDLCQRSIGKNEVSAVYLIGDGFTEDWYQEALRFLCHNRRVFRGNNLYSKGACHGILNRLDKDKLAQTYVYLGEDKLLANVGMNLLRQGEESYLALLNGGNSWYDCRKEWDVILEETNELTFQITPLNGKEITSHVMILSGLSSPRQPLTRIHLTVDMHSSRQLTITAKDRGFGEFYPSSGRVWEETIELA